MKSEQDKNTTPVSETNTPSLPKIPVEELDMKIGKVIQMSDIKENSILLLKVTRPSPLIVQALERIVELFGKELEEKKCGLLIMGPGTDLDMVDEATMNSIGWVKKEQSRIITL